MLGVSVAEKPYLVFQHCNGGAGAAFFHMPIFCSNTFDKDCITPVKSTGTPKRFCGVILKRVEGFQPNFQEIFQNMLYTS